MDQTRSGERCAPPACGTSDIARVHGAPSSIFLAGRALPVNETHLHHDADPPGLEESVEDHGRAYLDGAVRGIGDVGGDLNRLVQVFALDDIETAQLLFRLGEWAVS